MDVCSVPESVLRAIMYTEKKKYKEPGLLFRNTLQLDGQDIIMPKLHNKGIKSNSSYAMMFYSVLFSNSILHRELILAIIRDHICNS